MVESIATSFNLTTGFPRQVYHPVYGARTVNSFDDVKRLPDITRNWFNSAADADAARTQPEADAVIALHNMQHAQEMARAALAAQQQGEDGGQAAPQAPDLPEDHPVRHVVRNSVQAQEEANRMAADMVASGSVPEDLPTEAVMAGPVAPPLVPAQPQATENVERPEGGVGTLTDPEAVTQVTREAAASDIIPQRGQEVDLAGGDLDGRTEPVQTRERPEQPDNARTGGGAPPAEEPREPEPPA